MISSLRFDVVDVLRDENDVIVTTSSLREEITFRTSLKITVELFFLSRNSTFTFLAIFLIISNDSALGAKKTVIQGVEG